MYQHKPRLTADSSNIITPRFWRPGDQSAPSLLTAVRILLQQVIIGKFLGDQYQPELLLIQKRKRRSRLCLESAHYLKMNVTQTTNTELLMVDATILVNPKLGPPSQSYPDWSLRSMTTIGRFRDRSPSSVTLPSLTPALSPPGSTRGLSPRTTSSA